MIIASRSGAFFDFVVFWYDYQIDILLIIVGKLIANNTQYMSGVQVTNTTLLNNSYKVIISNIVQFNK